MMRISVLHPNNNKINIKYKKGVFVTLSAVLILIIIFSLVILIDQQSSEINEVNIQYSKHKVISNYINAVFLL